MLLERLAIGGMAEVHLAREAHGDQRLVALKQILPHLVEDPSFLAMFLDEARIAARLHHPNVVEIYDLGREGDALFIAMEYVHGEDLRRVEKRCLELSRPFPPALACRIVREAARGLDYAHKRQDTHGRPLGIVHRDVSPQNLLVSFEGVVKVADFGVAIAADKAHVTQSGIIKGKHPYMSPEQALGREELDCRTDVFALGTVLYEAVTGQRLFRRATDLQTLRAVAECQVVPPSKVTPGLPLELDDICMRALTRDRDRRFASAAELGIALEAFATNDREATVVHVGRFVSELFADRLQREAREKRLVPTFGVAPMPTPVTPEQVRAFDKAKTIEAELGGPVPMAPGAPAATEPMRAASSAPRSELVTRQSRPKGAVPDTTIPFDEPTRPPNQPTIPFGPGGGGGGTQAYGRGPVETVTATATQKERDPLSVLALPADVQRTILNVDPATLPPLGRRRTPRAKSPLPRVGAIALLAIAVAGGWYVYSRPRGPVVTPAKAAQRVEPCASPASVVSESGQRWVAAPVAEGSTLLLLSGPLEGTTQRELHGIAMVVETKDGRARIIAENLDVLPAVLFACPK